MKLSLFLLVSVFAVCKCCADENKFTDYDASNDYSEGAEISLSDNDPIYDGENLVDETADTDISADVECRCHKKRVAFMSYLSDCVDLGEKQHVKFDKVTLNDGKAYKPHTGVFTVPRSGVYSFTFTVAERHKRETRVRLVVDGKTVAGAVAEGRHPFHDAMGGNTALVSARRGQSVWIETINESHIEGSDKYRFSTFSGHLLYAK